jgi:hypothetical protein
MLKRKNTYNTRSSKQLKHTNISLHEKHLNYLDELNGPELPDDESNDIIYHSHEIYEILQYMGENEQLSSIELKKLNELAEKIENREITLKKIINTEYSDIEKSYLLERFLTFTELDRTDSSYYKKRDELHNMINGNNSIINTHIITDLHKLILQYQEQLPNDLQIIKDSTIDNGTKLFILQEYQGYLEMDKSNELYYSLRKWIQYVIRVLQLKKKNIISPYNIKTLGITLKNALDKELYGLDEIKTKSIMYTYQLQVSNNNSGTVLLLQGPPGTGKTSIAKCIANVLNRPLYIIGLGGINSATRLTGSNRVFNNSCPGLIVEAMLSTQCINPIILLDECDKISYRFSSEISGALMHGLDPACNNTFLDDYVDFQ